MDNPKNPIPIFSLNLDPNIWIWILKKSKLVLLKKWIWVENLIQLFRSKLYVDLIIKNLIHTLPYVRLKQWIRYQSRTQIKKKLTNKYNRI